MFTNILKFFKGLKKIDRLDEIEQRLKKTYSIVKTMNQTQQKISFFKNGELFQDIQNNSNIRELALTEIFKDIEDLLLPLGAIDENTSHPNKVDMLYVVAIAKYKKSANIFEFGTLFGKTTYYLTFSSDNPKIFTLDLPQEKLPLSGNNLGFYYKNTDREKFVTQLLCDSREFDTSPYRKKMDFIFVDGDHTHEMVKNDTKKAFEMLAPGGIILWHDYSPKKIDLVGYFQEFTKQTPLFRIKDTSLLLYIDGIDPMTFTPVETRVKKDMESNEAKIKSKMAFLLDD